MRLRTKEISWLLKEKYQGKLTDEAKQDIMRLKKGEPLAYLIGFVDFLGCKIDLSKRPLIPRSETEWWLDQAIQDIKVCNQKKIRCLDLFAGNGCIGIAILKNLSDTKVDFAEINDILLKQIRINVTLNKIDKKRVNIIKSDIFSNVNRKYDYIFANPPYIAETKKYLTQKSVLKYESHNALFSGKDGLDIIRKFLENARNYLKSEGRIYLEFDSWQKPKIIAILKNYGYNRYDFKKDQYGFWRYAIIS